MYLVMSPLHGCPVLNIQTNKHIHTSITEEAQHLVGTHLNAVLLICINNKNFMNLREGERRKIRFREIRIVPMV